ncbi:MAG: TlpA family protein disulfide reductase [bacterium]
MKKKAVILLVAVVVLGLISTILLIIMKPGKMEIAVGKPTPAFSLRNGDGNIVSSEQFKGKVMVLHFWATWCPPCIAEVPSMAKFYQRYASNDKVKFFFVLFQDSRANAYDFFRSAGVTLPLSFDQNNKTAHSFGVTGVPETYVINRDGILEQRIIGSAEWETPDAEDFFNRLLSF